SRRRRRCPGRAWASDPARFTAVSGSRARVSSRHTRARARRRPPNHEGNGKMNYLSGRALIARAERVDEIALRAYADIDARYGNIHWAREGVAWRPYTNATRMTADLRRTGRLASALTNEGAASMKLTAPLELAAIFRGWKHDPGRGRDLRAGADAAI